MMWRKQQYCSIQSNFVGTSRSASFLSHGNSLVLFILIGPTTALHIATCHQTLRMKRNHSLRLMEGKKMNAQMFIANCWQRQVLPRLLSFFRCMQLWRNNDDDIMKPNPFSFPYPLHTYERRKIWRRKKSTSSNTPIYSRKKRMQNATRPKWI